MSLSKHFTELEFLRSKTATQKKIKNTWSDSTHKANAIYLCENYLEPIRLFIDCPVNITSGYRNSELNKAIGGSPSSKHMSGQASDITCIKFSPEEFYNKIREWASMNPNKPIDQLILEPSWVHLGISLTKKSRQQFFKI